MIWIRRIILTAAAFAVVFAAAALLLRSWIGPFNGPGAAPTADQWERQLLERVKVPAGYRFSVYARGLGQPRIMRMTAKGDLIVSGYGDGTVSIIDAKGKRRVIAEALDSPHGLVLEGDRLFVAEESRVVVYGFDGERLAGAPKVVLDGIPGGGHSSRTLGRGPDEYLYLSVGSSCDSCAEEHPWRAAMLRFREGARAQIFASGLRNTVGFDWQPQTGNLYGVDNGRDGMGDDVPDDELNLIVSGGHYGWPFRHGFGVADPSLTAPAGADFRDPVAGFGAHHAPLAIKFLKYQGNSTFQGEALVTEHGSWNRSAKVGYRIIALDPASGAGPEPFLEGCLSGEEVICRPVDILEARDGRIFVSDDYAGAIYLIEKAP